VAGHLSSDQVWVVGLPCELRSHDIFGKLLFEVELFLHVIVYFFWLLATSRNAWNPQTVLYRSVVAYVVEFRCRHIVRLENWTRRAQHVHALTCFNLGLSLTVYLLVLLLKNLSKGFYVVVHYVSPSTRSTFNRHSPFPFLISGRDIFPMRFRPWRCCRLVFRLLDSFYIRIWLEANKAGGVLASLENKSWVNTIGT
jgi:hypothetical protein